MAHRARRSRLVLFGTALVMVALYAPQQVRALAAHLEGTARGVLFLLTDLFRVCFFVGFGCLFAGLLRDRSRAREPSEAPGPRATPPTSDRPWPQGPGRRLAP